MAWSTPLSAVDGAVLTFGQWNASVRDNLLETAPAKATTANGIFVTSATNVIAQRNINHSAVATNVTTASTTYTATLSGSSTGPTVLVTSGTRVLIGHNANCENTLTALSLMSFAVSGATTQVASDEYALMHGSGTSQFRLGVSMLSAVLTSGSNTFTSEYRVSAGTGQFQNRRMWVLPL